MVVISVVNNKGGVGKSTIASSIAQALALLDYQVLCIDNDNQRNLATMNGVFVKSDKTIGDLYHLKDVVSMDEDKLDVIVSKCIIQSRLDNLHVITAPDSLCDADVEDEKILSLIFKKSFISDTYGFVIIDNHPGLSTLQLASLHPADYVLVPTEPQQLAVDGLSIMMHYLTKVMEFKPEQVRIIINKYRPSILRDSYVSTIKHLFPRSIVEPSIPMDSTFDTVIALKKVLFLDRLESSTAVPFIVAMMSQIFDGFEEKRLYRDIRKVRDKHLSDNARIRAMQSQTISEGAEK